MHFFTQINDEQLYWQIYTMVMVTRDQVKEEETKEKEGRKMTLQ